MSMTSRPSLLAGRRGALRLVALLGAAALTITAALVDASAARADDNPLSVAPISVTTAQGQPVSIRLAGSGPAGDALYYSVAPGFGNPALVAPSHGTVVMDTSALVVTNAIYTPAAGFSGQDSFQYRVSDSAWDSAPATVTVTVTPASATNRPPTATPQSITVESEQAVDITLGGTDPDGDPLIAAVVTPPAHGALIAIPGRPGVVEYQPRDYVGSDSLTFTVSDGVLTSAPATVQLTVTPPRANTPPVASNVSLTTAQNTPVAFRLTGSDADGDPVSVFVWGDPQHGTVTGSGNDYVYTPSPGFVGTDSFQYDVNDGRASSPDYGVTVTVTGGSAPATPSPSVDSAVVADQLSSGRSIVSAKLTTHGPNRLLLAFVSADGPLAGGQKTSVTGGGLSWSLVRRANGTGGTAEVWQAWASGQLTDAVVTASLAKRGFDGEITVVAFAGAAPVSRSAGASGTDGLPAVTLATPTAGSFVWGVGHDWSTAAFPVAPSGQSIEAGQLDTRSLDTYWTQRLVGVSDGTSTTLRTANPVGARWQFVGVEVPAAPVTTTTTY